MSQDIAFMDLPEVCTVTTLSKPTIYRLVQKGELRIVKLGFKTVFLKSEVAAWMAAKARL